MVIFFLATFAVLMALDTNRWLRAILAVLLLRNGFSVWREHAAMTGGRSIYRLIGEAGRWQLQDRLGQYSAELCPESTVTSVVCFLVFRLNGIGRKRTCLVFRDALSKDIYRQLLVYLRTVKAYPAEENR